MYLSVKAEPLSIRFPSVKSLLKSSKNYAIRNFSVRLSLFSKSEVGYLRVHLSHQATRFGTELLCQAMLSNHLNLVLKSRTDVVKELDDNEVARWWRVFCPEPQDEKRCPLEPSEHEIHSTRNDKLKLTLTNVHVRVTNGGDGFRLEVFSFRTGRIRILSRGANRPRRADDLPLAGRIQAFPDSGISRFRHFQIQAFPDSGISRFRHFQIQV